MKRILVTSTDVMMLQFLVPHIFNFVEQGYYVEVVCSDVEGHIEELTEIFQGKIKMSIVSLKRSPWDKKNIEGYKQLKDIIQKGKFDLVWTNEPVMGVLTRLAARKAHRKCKIKVLYIAHGFHFYKGASLLNWLVFYPIESIMARFTDKIITINQEDYEFALKHFKHTDVEKYPGIGVDTEKFKKIKVAKESKCIELDISSQNHIYLSVGELEKRKNHITTIKAFAQADIEDSVLLICGIGSQKEEIQKLINSLQLQEKVRLLGYRYDIGELLSISDVFTFTTYQEGLSVALMEAMANGIICLVSKIRGNVDLIEEGKGIYCDPKSVDSCRKAILKANQMLFSMDAEKKYNQEKISEYDIVHVKRLISATVHELLET